MIGGFIKAIKRLSFYIYNSETNEDFGIVECSDKPEVQ